MVFGHQAIADHDGGGLGADGLSEYEPPSAALVTGLAELADEDEPLDRAGEVERFVAQAGGEAG